VYIVKQAAKRETTTRSERKPMPVAFDLRFGAIDAGLESKLHDIVLDKERW
jgi:hypothetical protein